MNNQSVLLLIAIGVLIAVLFVVPSSENFGYTAYIPDRKNLLDRPAKSSVDCTLFPESPACQPRPPVGPVEAGIESCAPADGGWSTPGTGPQGRSTLASKCCQPPDYQLGKEKTYKTCDDALDMSVPVERCVADCCINADIEANNYDASWYPMARCACSLWCYNQNVSHFRKYGTAVHYITGDLAEAHTSDTGDFIGSGVTFSG